MTGTNSPAKARQVTAGGIGGVAAAAIMVGEAVAHLAAGTRQYSLIVVTSVAIIGALIGGFLTAPSLRRFASKGYAENQDERSSPLTGASSSLR